MTLLPRRGVKASLISLAIVATACSCGGGPSAAPLAGCNAGTTQVLFWTSHTPPDTDSMKHMVDAFNKQSTTSCVKMVSVPGSETDIAKLTTAVRGGTGPDVYELDRFTVAERAAAGVLTDLSSFGAANEASNYLDFAWKEALFKGKPYALPFDTDARALFYNKDMLQAAGIDAARWTSRKVRQRLTRFVPWRTSSTRKMPLASTRWLGLCLRSARVGTTPGALHMEGASSIPTHAK
ncbi:MAG: extracellular solute-binding protein [Chloroflexi bacterium]|nr:MAG: extracellular solute-binding protein [Chloroflexota bacterium]